MEMFCIWSLFLLVTIAVTAEADDPSYAIIVPSVLRPGRTFDVSIQTFGETGKFEVTARINRKNKNKALVSISETLSGSSQYTISLQVPKGNVEDEHVFKIKATGAVQFENETTIQTSFKTVTVLIQTDKAIYKPGQTILFRCMAVFSDLKPYLNRFNVEIMDVNDNKMAEWIRKKDNSGVFGGKFELSSSPVLGDWKIKCAINTGESATKTLTIEEFVLPKVEAKVELPSFFHRTRLPLVATVSAKYTYGKPVRGAAVVSIKSTSNRWSPKTYPELTRTVSLVNGKKDVMYTEDDLRKLYVCTSSFCQRQDFDTLDRLVGHTLNVSTVITDEVTGDEWYAESTVQFARQLHQLKFLEITPETFKDGLVWTGFVQITLPDGSPPLESEIKDEMLNVSYACSGFRKEEDGLEVSFRKTIPKRYPIPQSGVVVIDFLVDKGMTECDVRPVFQSNPSRATAFKRIEKFVSRDEQGLQITMPDQDGPVTPGISPVKFALKSTDPITKFYYQLLSKGRLVQQGNMPASGTKNSFSITFDSGLAQETAPSARIVVWYLTDSGEVIVDSLEFNVKGAFANDVRLNFDQTEVRPGDNVSLTVNCYKKSYVGLLAVDQSVLLLKTGNDITQQEVLDDLSNYDSKSRPVPRPIPLPRPVPIGKKKRRRKRSFYCRWCYFPRTSGGKDAKEVFENSGVNIMTNAHIHTAEEPFVFIRPTRRPGRVQAQAGPVAPLPQPTFAPDAPDQEELQEPDAIRQIFPETWLWESKQAGNNGKVTVNAKAPDTITSWVASAFAMSREVGLGIAAETSKLIVFKEFFAQLDLPFSAIRGELLELKVLVFNYLSTKQKVTVTLEKPPNDEFFASRGSNKKPKKAVAMVQDVEVDPEDGVELSFWVLPVVLGQVPVTVKAQSTQAADALRRMLLIEPEGEPCEYSKSYYIELNGTNTFSAPVNVEFPGNVVEGSQRVMFSAIGDIMGPTMNNLDRLLRLPGGCGEQNMLSFAPNIYVLDYLTATNQLNSPIKTKAEGFMSKGYQNQLRFQRSDGSFSAFGDRDSAGSMWLTAFVIRSFERAKPYTAISQNIINQGLNWILRRQDEDGSFKEPPGGRTIHTDMQGGASKGTPLTAYVLITLLELEGSTSVSLTNAITAAFDHLVGLLPTVKGDVYAMALINYAFQFNDHPKKNQVLQYFNNLATIEGGNKYWERDDKEIRPVLFWRPPYRRQPSNSIEMTAYAVLAALIRDDVGEAATIIRWLAAQRNAFGGYSSTQDTVVGIDALAQFSSRTSASDRQNVLVQVKDGQTYSFNRINKKSFDVLQQLEVDPSDTALTLEAEGTGVVLVQMNVFFNKKENKDDKGYVITVTSAYRGALLYITICFSYKIVNIASGMVIVELDLPTGHVPVTATLLSQYRSLGLKKFEFLRGKTLALYFDEATSKEICITIIAAKIQNVEFLQSALCKIRSYYRPDVYGSTLYLPGSSECPKLTKKERKWKTSVCDGSNCTRGTCKKLSKKNTRNLFKDLCKTKDGSKYCCSQCKKLGFL